MSNKYREDMTVQLVQSTASDKAVAMAARVSTAGETHTEEATTNDAGLINYLMKARHGSPFEHNMFTFYIETPIFVAREFFRHRIGFSYNETSGRYRELEPVFYIPGPSRPLVQEGKVGHYTFVKGTYKQYDQTVRISKWVYGIAYQAYDVMLKLGVAKEVARIVLPVGTYTSFYATCNARSLMHFLSLRTKDETSTYPSYPQQEIEMVAQQMEEIFKREMPDTWTAFQKNGRVAP